MARSVTDTPRILVVEDDENLHGLIIKVGRCE
jgi:hypothetical protein